MTKHTFRWIILGLISAILLVGTNDLLAQSANSNRRRNRQSREQRYEQRLEQYRELLEIASNDEWKVIQPRIEKVLKDQEETRVRSDWGRRSRSRRNRNTDSTNTTSRTSNQEIATLQSVSTNTSLSKEEIKAKLAEYRNAQKTKAATLAKDQEELRKLLSVRQEAIAVLNGLLK